METITFLNRKGGVGKTSTVFHLSAALAKLGRRVLLIDSDPQGSLTQGFWGPEGLASFAPEQTIAVLFGDGLVPPPAALIRPTGLANVDILPGSEQLAEANMRPPSVWHEHQFALRELLADIDHDVVLIDCPPNLHLCSWAALIASTRIVVPLQAEDFGSQGLAPVQRAVSAVQAGPNPSLKLAGYLLTMFDKRLSLHATYESLLRDRYGSDVFTAQVPRAKDFPEAVANRMPLGALKPKCASAKAVDLVAAELIGRCGSAAEAERGAA